jgi:hypothetical protein
LCTSNLARLPHLQTLKLAMELREDSYEYSTDGGARKVGSVSQSAQKWADALALRLPALQSVAFERRPHTRRGLGPRVLIGQPSWAWFSRGEEDSDSNIMHHVGSWDEDVLKEPEREIRRDFPQEPPPEFSPPHQDISLPNALVPSRLRTL